MLRPIKIGISSCLLGNKVRYDGGHSHDGYLTQTLGLFAEYIPVCPEVECGMPIPREAVRLVGGPENPRLMTQKTGVDKTEQMKTWIDGRLKELLSIIDQYGSGYVPLIVPITLIKHYVMKYDQPWLKTQTYLNPHPFELKLRNYI